MNNTLPNQKKLVPISEAAKILGVSIDTIRRWDKSGLLHSERLDGKNRYFSLEELESYKFNQPLSISEVAQELQISPTTLRRLEDRGLIKPNRNNAGERIFDKESIDNFLSSGYFLKGKQVQEETSGTSQEEVEIQPDITQKQTEQLEKNELVSNIRTGSLEAKPVVTEMPQPSKWKPLQMMPGFLAATVIFVLLTAIGITNIQTSTIKAAQPLPATEVLSAQIQPAEKVAPTLIETEIVSTPAAALTAPPAASASAKLEPELLTKVKISTRSATVSAHQKAATNSGATARGHLKDKADDTLEVVSVDSKGYHVKLSDGSIGFIPLENIQTKEVKP